MSKQRQLRAFRKGLADSVLSASDDELVEEVRDEGLDPHIVAEETRALLLKTVKDFKQRALASAREQHRQRAARLAAQQYQLPASPAERRQLLDAVIAQHQQMGRMLIAQHRNFEELTDDDVESWLQQFGALGLLDKTPGPDK
jgi:hypothetical protein